MNMPVIGVCPVTKGPTNEINNDDVIATDEQEATNSQENYNQPEDSCRDVCGMYGEYCEQICD